MFGLFDNDEFKNSKSDIDVCEVIFKTPSINTTIFSHFIILN